MKFRLPARKSKVDAYEAQVRHAAQERVNAFFRRLRAPPPPPNYVPEDGPGPMEEDVYAGLKRGVNAANPEVPPADTQAVHLEIEAPPQKRKPPQAPPQPKHKPPPPGKQQPPPPPPPPPPQVQPEARSLGGGDAEEPLVYAELEMGLLSQPREPQKQKQPQQQSQETKQPQAPQAEALAGGGGGDDEIVYAKIIGVLKPDA